MGDCCSSAIFCPSTSSCVLFELLERSARLPPRALPNAIGPRRSRPPIDRCALADAPFQAVLQPQEDRFWGQKPRIAFLGPQAVNRESFSGRRREWPWPGSMRNQACHDVPALMQDTQHVQHVAVHPIEHQEGEAVEGPDAQRVTRQEVSITAGCSARKASALRNSSVKASPRPGAASLYQSWAALASFRAEGRSRR